MGGEGGGAGSRQPLAPRHLAEIPPSSGAATDANALAAELQEREATFKAAQARQTEKEGTTNAVRNASMLAITQLSSDLKNLGYELSVEAGGADAPTEIVITSSDFDETDHRVRFLASIRGRNAPTAAACWNGFDRVRLRSSRIPLVGFSEIYSICQ
jgi:hypothetical protein